MQGRRQGWSDSPPALSLNLRCLCLCLCGCVWVQFDEMVWDEFGQDDHTVPRTGLGSAGAEEGGRLGAQPGRPRCTQAARALWTGGRA